MYPDPDHFIPQRFLNKHGHLDAEGKDPADFVFGFGRRCDFALRQFMI